MTQTVNETGKSQLKRWVAMLISPIAFSVCFLLVYTFNELVCGLNLFRSASLGQETVTVTVLLAITVVTSGLTVAGAFMGRRIRLAAQRKTGEEAERDRFIGLSALLMGIYFTLLTVGLAVVFIVLDPC